MKFWTLVIGFAVLMGCSSLSKDQSISRLQMLPPAVEWNQGRPPQEAQTFLDAYLKENPTREAEQWARYQEGLIWKSENAERSCRAFGPLAQDQSFALHDLAELHARSVCAQAEPLTWAQYQELIARRPWLKTRALEVAYLSAERSQNAPDLIQVYLSRLSTTPRNDDKVELIKKAKALADQLGDAKQIEDLNNKLYNVAPRLRPNPPLAELLAVAKDFRQAREFDSARTTYQRILKEKSARDDDRYKALMGLRQTFKLEQKTDDYVRVSKEAKLLTEKQWLKHKKDSASIRRFHEAAIQYIRTIWTEGQVKDATLELAKLEGRLKGHFALDEVYWLRARLEEEAGHFDLATRWFEKALSQSPARSALREKIAWYLAWNYRKQKEFDRSLKLLEELRTTSSSTFEQAKYGFWHARTLKDKGEMDSARSEFKALTQSDPVSYYGLLSYRELQTSFPANPPHRDRKARKGSLAFESSADYRYAEWLIATGESDVAALFLNQFAERYQAKRQTDVLVWSDLLEYYLAAGQYAELFKVVGGLENDLRTKLLEQNLEFLFPRPHYPLVSSAAQRFGVSAELLYAIMRQESAFDPHARSPADAFGLLQLIPSAAKKAAASASVGFASPEDLYKPEVNIPLGAAFIRKLMDAYKGQFILTAASYNASEKAIQGWLKTRLREEAIEFIEDIPYDETRGYVKLVLRNFVFYSRLTAPSQQLSFPEWCLENLDSFR